MGRPGGPSYGGGLFQSSEGLEPFQGLWILHSFPEAFSPAVEWEHFKIVWLPHASELMGMDAREYGLAGASAVTSCADR